MLTGITTVTGTSLVGYPAHVSRERSGCHAVPGVGAGLMPGSGLLGLHIASQAAAAA
jgi:hypothetical protein